MARFPPRFARVDPTRSEDAREALRPLHDRLERAYVRLARRSTRFIEHETGHGTCIGYRGMDAAPMNRVVGVNAEDAVDVDALLADADAFFTRNGGRWSVQSTPFSAPRDLPRVLRSAGFRVNGRFAILTWNGAWPEEDAARARERDVMIRACGPEDVQLFTSLVVDVFRMPRRFLAPLVDIHRDWMHAGARFLLAWRGWQPVGAAVLAGCDGVNGVYSVATSAAHRRRGVASALMENVLRAHEEDGGSVLTLQVARGSPAESFYLRRGFEHRYDWVIHAAPEKRAASGPG